MPLDTLVGQIDVAPAKGHGRAILVGGRAEGAALDAIAMVEGRHSACLSVATPGTSGSYTFTLRNRGGLKIMAVQASVIGDVAKLAQVTAIDEATGEITVDVVDEALAADTLEASEYLSLLILLDSI